MEARQPVSEANRHAQGLFHGLPARYDVLAEVLSFGQNARWRDAMLDPVVAAEPATVLDVATGTGAVALGLAKRTRATITGIDLTESMLQRARSKIAAEGYEGRIRVLVGRAEALPFADSMFDGLTFTYLLRYVADPSATLNEMARVVRPGGMMASLDFYVPPNRLWRAAWWLYTRLLLPVGSIAGGRSWMAVGRFLGPNISQFYGRHGLSWLVDAWQQAGLRDVGVRIMSFGGGLVMWGTKGHG